MVNPAAVHETVRKTGTTAARGSGVLPDAMYPQREHTIATRRVMFRTALTGAGAALVTGACGPFGGGREEQPGSLPTGKAPVTVTYISLTSADRQQMEEEIFADFTREAPHITVEVSGASTNWNQVREKFLVTYAAGTPVHIVQGGFITWLEMWERGAVVDLDPFFKRDKIDPSAIFIDPAVSYWRHDGKLWGVPVSTSIDAMAYNVELFAAAGLRPPPVDPTASWWNMDTFLDYARKLTDRNKQQFGYGGRVAGGNQGGFSTGTYFGQGAWDDVNRKCLMDTPAFQRGLQFWKDMPNVHRVEPTSEESAQIRGGQNIDVFFTGKIGMQVVLIVQAALPFKWAVATLPYAGPPGTKNVSGRTHNHALLMGKGTEQQREAVWQLYRWLTKPQNAGRFPRSAGHVVSPLKDPAASELTQRLYRQQLGVDPKAYLLQAQTTRPPGFGMVRYPRWAQVGPEVDQRYTQELITNKVGVQEYATWVTKYIDDNLGAKGFGR